MTLLAANWKMHKTIAEAEAFIYAFLPRVEAAAGPEIAICPSFLALQTVVELCAPSRVKVFAQNMHQEPEGAYTGEVSPTMLAKLGVSYVVVGHSERREYHAEDDALVAAKAKAAFAQGIVPIVCIGEGLDIRKAGDQVSYTLAQLDGSLDGLPAEQAATVVIAYEPVWAIGTGEVATPQDAQEVCGAIRARLAELYSPELADGVRVLYGGSVKSGNIAAIMAEPDVDGALVGGASLDAEEFARIVRYQSHQVGL